MTTLMMFVVVAPSSMATDICSNDPLSSADFYVKTNSAVYLRDISCMDSKIQLTLPAGELLRVVGKTEDWYKVVRSNGIQGWLWSSFLDQTDEVFDAQVDTGLTDTDVMPLNDISDSKYHDAVMYVYDNGMVSGYPDGSYKPNKVINRAELLKIIIEANYDEQSFGSFASESCFSDVKPGLWYTKYVCFAKMQGIVKGYSDKTFKPAQEINFVEALKIATIAFGHDYKGGDPWYKPTVDYAASMNIVPLDVVAFDQKFSRGQMAELISRMLKYQEGQDAFDTFVGDLLNYKVTYNTIKAGLNVEDVAGTGKCIDSDGSTLYEDGASVKKSECTTCVCSKGNWLCTGLCMK